jgi:hypothetical protein
MICLFEEGKSLAIVMLALFACFHGPAIYPAAPRSGDVWRGLNQDLWLSNIREASMAESNSFLRIVDMVW